MKAQVAKAVSMIWFITKFRYNVFESRQFSLFIFSDLVRLNKSAQYLYTLIESITMKCGDYFFRFTLFTISNGIYSDFVPAISNPVTKTLAAHLRRKLFDNLLFPFSTFKRYLL